MKKQELSFKYTEITDLKELDEISIRLINKAKAASKNAWAPYSGFRVGAALLLENGEIITGNNQENAAFPSGLCAERTAIFYANSVFPDVPVKMLAVAAQQNDTFIKLAVAPCGSCRQVILETQNRFKNKITLMMYGEEKTIIVEDAAYLLPFPFEGF
ncbi:MAG: cytidine deaminase [Bacteroidales bacterium]|nr:cytidine deaminase [Bacteroidales bacterium]MCF8391450.1 cytidine deaminase [Bacteroidales bacterium]